MTWLAILALAMVAFVAAAWLFKPAAAARTTLAAALMLGLAGYAWQANPDLAGAPAAPRENATEEAKAMVDARRAMSGDSPAAAPGGGNNWLVVGDAFARRGQFADAATVYRGALEKDPRNAEAWLALANALVAHADGNLTPASVLAFRRAQAADPAQPGPALFLGMALARSGRFEEARTVWADLLARSPPDAPWRGELTAQIARLDGLIRSEGAPPRER